MVPSPPIRRAILVAPSFPPPFEEKPRKGWVQQNASHRPRKTIPASEQGYVMLIAIFLIVLLVISLAVAAPKVARSIQRDRDLETFHRGMQYRRAIQLYYRKFHAYPPNVEALLNTNDIHFLRKKYIDPMTGQDDWKPIAFGQNKTPTAMGFFGQPLAGNASTLAGIGPSGGTGGLPGSPNSTSGFGSGSSSGGFSSGSSSGSIFGSSDTSSDQPSPTSGSGTTDTSGTPSGTPGSTGSTSPGDTSSTGTGTGSNAPTFGGAGIIGFEPASPKQSILVYKKKNHYNEWEFTYDPLSDMQTVGGGNTGLVGQPASSTTTPVGSPTFGGPAPGGPPLGGNNPGASTPDLPAPQ
jgi:type II secretory pathway pseudopilin PulG